MSTLYQRTDSAANIARKIGKSRAWVSRNMAPAEHPEMDSEGYPTDATLKKITEWSVLSNFACRELMYYCQEAWTYHDYFSWRGKIARVSTAGWSGNESIIAALQKNRAFWALCWVESRRGGHYRFHVSPFKERKQ
jgi:hypothetical protein